VKRLLRGAAPGCLASYQHGRDRWDDLTPACRAEVRAQLDAMQGRLCAYCEGDLDTLVAHVEHLWPRGQHPTRTFDWHNLFLSCDREDSCGTYKDRGGKPYDPAALIDPSRDDPDDFFRARDSGQIEVRPGLSAHDAQRARETLRVFNLNLDGQRGRSRSLCAARRRALALYRAVNPGILEELATWPEADREAFLREELRVAATQPFGMIVRHFLMQCA